MQYETLAMIPRSSLPEWPAGGAWFARKLRRAFWSSASCLLAVCLRASAAHATTFVGCCLRERNSALPGTVATWKWTCRRPQPLLSKQAVASLTALGINPKIPKKKPPTAEEAAAAKAQVELRKRARESEQAEQAAAMDLEDSEHTLASPGSAWQLVKNAADARAERKSATAAAIKKTLAEDAEVPPPEASAELATGSMQITPTPEPAAGHRIKRKKKVEDKTEKPKPKKKKVLPEAVEEPEEEQEQPDPAPLECPKGACSPHPTQRAMPSAHTLNITAQTIAANNQ